MNAERSFSCPEEVLYRELEGQFVMVDLRSGEYFSLSGASAEIWRLAIASTPFSEICRHLEYCFQATPEQLEKDAMNLIDSLLRQGLLIENV